MVARFDLGFLGCARASCSGKLVIERSKPRTFVGVQGTASMTSTEFPQRPYKLSRIATCMDSQKGGSVVPVVQLVEPAPPRGPPENSISTARTGSRSGSSHRTSITPALNGRAVPPVTLLSHSESELARPTPPASLGAANRPVGHLPLHPADLVRPTGRTSPSLPPKTPGPLTPTLGNMM